MKLQLKHLAPYLPYGLRIFNKDNKGSYILSTGSIDRVIELPEIFKPILRPLSDLVNSVHHLKLKSWFKYHAENDVLITCYDNGNEVGITATYKMMGDVFTDIIVNAGGINDTDYWLVQNLLKNHYDVFGLIEKGLAIDINTIT
jgi:hypothetical protein